MPNRSYARDGRRAAILVMSAVMMVVLVGMVAFGVDIGYIVLMRTQLQAAADSAALAGAGAAIDGTAAAEAEALKYVSLHTSGGENIDADQVEIRFGSWDSASRRFTPSLADRSAIEVTVRGDRQPFFFGRIFGQGTFGAEAKAVATFAPRDIMLVLDYSLSMCNDSRLMSIGTLGRNQVESSLREMYEDLGSPTYGNMQFEPVYIDPNSSQGGWGGRGGRGGRGSSETVLEQLELDGVRYPYPGGSWDDYIDYVQTDSNVASAGYQNKYGYLTWVNYLQARQGSYRDTPDLWQTREQPVTAVKDAVDLLAVYLEENCPDDRMGLSVYTYSNNQAVLESSMIHEFDEVADIVRHRQAGHYDPYTNIYDGMKTARREFERNARAGARRLMVLMTDGQANRPGNTSNARRKALQEAQEAADAGIPIITISLGAGADTDLMEEIAEITHGAYFEIPGGQTVAQYEEDLKEIFRQVAADRSLMLVQ